MPDTKTLSWKKEYLENTVRSLKPPKRLPKDKEDLCKCFLSSLPDEERGLLTSIFRSHAKELKIGYMKLICVLLTEISLRLEVTMTHVVSMVVRSEGFFAFLEKKRLLPAA